MDSRQKQLLDLVARRDRAREQVQRVRGRLDSARRDLASVEEECVRRKIPPDQLDNVIDQLTQRYDSAVADMERRIADVEIQIASFLEEP